MALCQGSMRRVPINRRCFSAGDAAGCMSRSSAGKAERAFSKQADDPQRREQMGRTWDMSAWTRELSWESSVEQLLATYHRAVKLELQPW